MFRVSAAVTLLSSLALITPAHAAPDAATIQTQLQSEWSDFVSRMGSGVASSGDIKVTQSGAAYEATLPPLTINLQATNKVKLSPISVTATPSAAGTLNLKINLPTTIPQYYQNTQTGTMTIGKQDLNIAVKPAGDTWQVQTINGAFSNLNWSQANGVTTNPYAPTSATLAQLNLSGKPNALELVAKSIQSRNVIGETQSIGTLTLTQQPSTPQSLRLSDVLVLLTGTVPQLESGHGGMSSWLQGAAAMTAHITDFKQAKADGKPKMMIDDIVLKNSLAGMNADKLTMRMTAAAKGIMIGVPAAFADTAPKALDFAGTVRNLPVSYLSMPFNSPEAQQRARAVLAASGTQLQIDSLNVATTGGLKANGTGLLTATSTAPTYTSGNVILNLTNLQDTLAKLQQQMKAPTQNANTGQAMMALMLLQGMGKANGSQTQYVVNFTPSGQILLNDQDLSGLLNLAGVKQKQPTNARAIPVAPVSQENMTPAPALNRAY